MTYYFNRVLFKHVSTTLTIIHVRYKIIASNTNFFTLIKPGTRNIFFSAFDSVVSLTRSFFGSNSDDVNKSVSCSLQNEERGYPLKRGYFFINASSVDSNEPFVKSKLFSVMSFCDFSRPELTRSQSEPCLSSRKIISPDEDRPSTCSGRLQNKKPFNTPTGNSRAPSPMPDDEEESFLGSISFRVRLGSLGGKTRDSLKISNHATPAIENNDIVLKDRKEPEKNPGLRKRTTKKQAD